MKDFLSFKNSDADINDINSLLNESVELTEEQESVINDQGIRT